jgi:hypothetical protein
MAPVPRAAMDAGSKIVCRTSRMCSGKVLLLDVRTTNAPTRRAEKKKPSAERDTQTSWRSGIAAGQVVGANTNTLVYTPPPEVREFSRVHDTHLSCITEDV